MTSKVNDVTGRHTILWEPAERDAGPEPFAEAVSRFVAAHRIDDAILFALTQADADALSCRPGFRRVRADFEMSRPWPAHAGPSDRSGIRPATAADTESICAIIAEAMRVPFGAITTPGDVRRDCFQPGRFDAILSVDGTDAAYGNAIHTGPGAGSIGWLVVRPAFQRRGLGTRLFRVLLEELDRHPRERIWLDVEEADLGAIRLYESFGFTRTGSPRVQVEYSSPGV